MSEERIPIFYACDDNFVKYTAVSLSSMIANAAGNEKYEVHVLNTNISEDMRAVLTDMQNERFTVSFDDVSGYIESVEDRLPVRHYYTKTTYFRLFIADMFPQYDKVIYIDSDTVVLGDIAELYRTDLGDMLVGACSEQVMQQVEVYGRYCEEVVGVSRYSFFNAGLLLINSAEWRRRNMLEKFINCLIDYNFVVTQDEDYLNVICKDRVRRLNQRWNTEVSAGLEYPYDLKEAKILHFVMVNKPWHYAECRCADVFWSYADRTAVADLLRAELTSYTDGQRERDRISCEHLKELAISEIENPNNYRKIINRTRRSADRVAVCERIAEYERAGRFDEDVEDDPPSRTLMPDEIDYLRKSPLAKLKTFIAYRRAKKFLNYITDREMMVIKEIRGLENLKKLDTGAVITCNHFNPFDTFAMHYAYLRSGQKRRKLYRVIREGNYTSFPGFYGYLMRNFYTLPLSSNLKTMKKFNDATERLLSEGNFVLVYPEQSMWWNYRKPKPLKPGAFSIAARAGVPVLPCFITMRDSDRLGEDGYPIQEYIINIGEPIYQDRDLSHKAAVEDLMAKNSEVWKNIYEDFYAMPLRYAEE